MREIKFRAWDKEYSVMTDDVFIEGDGNVYESANNTYDTPNVELERCDFTVMQFTGLQDKTGADIYEGDLLRIPAKNQYENKTYNCFEVFYHSNECIGGQNIGFCINRMHTQGNSGGGQGYKFTPESMLKHGFIVIGNIHQNKELLND